MNLICWYKYQDLILDVISSGFIFGVEVILLDKVKLLMSEKFQKLMLIFTRGEYFQVEEN